MPSLTRLNVLTVGLILAAHGAPGAAAQAPAPGGGSGQGSALSRECIAYRASGSRGKKGTARFVPDREDPGFRPRAASLTRHVRCGFKGGKVWRASEQFYLRLESQDRDN